MYTLGDIARCSARSFSGRTAIVFEGTSLTYRELNERVNRLCSALQSQGVGKGDRLAVLSENTHKYLEIYFAAGKLGVSVTPLNFRLADPELRQILDHSESTVLFVGDGYEERARQLVGDLPRIRRSISMDNRADGFELLYEALLAAGSTAEPDCAVDEEELAILMYTGGTTGLPKGVMMSHRALMMAFTSAALSFSFSKQDTTCFILPLFHVSFWPAFAHLLVGGKVAITRRPDLEGVLTLIQKERCTHINAVPTIYNWMLQLVDPSAYDLSTLRIISYAGSPFPPEVLKRCIQTFGPKFAQAYGMTECIGGAMLPIEDHDPDGRPHLLASAGKPFPGVDLAIVGSADQRLPPGEIGEIVLRGKCMMKGYWKNPELTASTLRDGWYHTGDMGYEDEEGYLFLVDRKADMIVTGGENVYPKEVEDVLYQHPAVAMAAVVSAPDERWGERVQAVVTLKPGQKVEGEELIAHCKGRLAGYKCPKKVEIWKAVPTSPVGKILRKDIKKVLWQGHDRMIG